MKLLGGSGIHCSGMGLSAMFVFVFISENVPSVPDFVIVPDLPIDFPIWGIEQLLAVCQRSAILCNAPVPLHTLHDSPKIPMPLPTQTGQRRYFSAATTTHCIASANCDTVQIRTLPADLILLGSSSDRVCTALTP